MLILLDNQWVKNSQPLGWSTQGQLINITYLPTSGSSKGFSWWGIDAQGHCNWGCVGCLSHKNKENFRFFKQFQEKGNCLWGVMS